MMEFFRKQENRKMIFVMAALVVLGAILLLARRFETEPEEYIREVFYKYAETSAFADTVPQRSFEQEEAIEERLAEFFSLVENAGNVRVMVSLLGTRETSFAVDVNESRSYTTEQDGQGGTREQHQHQSAEQTVIINDRSGTSTPLILREIEPRIEGIVIIAEGGDCPFVRTELTRAARALLGLEAHMVQILAMKN
jgi:stage III sporulation protein AG